MQIETLGDASFIIRDLPGPAFVYASALRELGHPEILDVSAAYETVGVYTAPGGLTQARLLALLANSSNLEILNPTLHVVPVLYEGEDLASVCEVLGITAADLAQLHSGREYRCFAVGFCPGFPYLGWLDTRLHGTTRKPSPRTRIEPGSVAITGKQTAIYPLVRPGGWNLIGRTPLTIVDVDDNYFPISAGDLVTFRAIDEDEFVKLKGERL